MKDFLMGWTYKKELAANVLIYTAIGVAGNLLFNKNKIRQFESTCFLENPIEAVREMPKKQKIFNCALFGTFALDTTASLLFLKYIKSKLA